MVARQLPLQFEFYTEQTFDSFFVGPNVEIVEVLKQASATNGEQFIYLWGEKGSGKSHLMNSCCHWASRQGRDVRLLPMQQLIGMPPEMLEGLAGTELLCLDDIQLIGGDAEWEMAIFDLFNQQRERGQQLIVAGNCPPVSFMGTLADLKTRLSWGLTLELRGFNDEERVASLVQQAEALGMALAPDAARYLLVRFPRDPHSLSQLLTMLDRESMAAQRRLTIPFLKEVLCRLE
jgi:DnaA family protein